MINQQQLSGRWHEIRGKLKQRFGKLTDDDLQTFNGTVEQLVGSIQRKTGESREAVENFLSGVAEGTDRVLDAAADRMEDLAEQSVDTMRDGYQALRQGYAEAERVVQSRPGQSMALAFGMGVLSGLGAALLMRDHGRESRLLAGHTMAERLFQQLSDALARVAPESLKRS